MNGAADERTRNHEFFNSPVSRYVRDASTGIRARQSSGAANSPYRALARAVIFNALKDLREQVRERNRTIRMLESSPRYRMIRQFTDNWGRDVIEYYDSMYGRKRIISTEPAQDVRRFFSGGDYIFYAEIAGINVSGPVLMQTFLKRYPNGIVVSLDQLIDG